MEGPTILLWSLAVSVLLFISLTYTQRKISKKPRIHAGNRKLVQFLSTHIPILKKKYCPCWLFGWSGKLQTILHEFYRLPKSKKLPYRREIFDLPDGGQIGLDFLVPPPHSNSSDGTKSRESNLLVLMLPGLTSTSHSSYIKSLALTLNEIGVMVVTANHRGLARVPLKTPVTYCAANPQDVRQVILHLKKKFPHKKIVALGTSLGGMILSQYLIKHSQEAKENLSAAILLSIVWDPEIGMASLEKPIMNSFINLMLAISLRTNVRGQLKVLGTRQCHWDLNKTVQSRGVRQFDTHFIAPQFGYDSAHDYYVDACVTGRIHKFSIPVFAFNGYDDPMQPGGDLPVSEAERGNSNLALIVTEYGGHLGFLESSFPRPFHYMEKFVGQLVAAIDEHGDQLL